MRSLVSCAAITLAAQSLHAQQVPDDARIDTATVNATVGIPWLAIDEERVHAVWIDTRTGDLDLYYNHSLDRGRTWGASDTRLNINNGAGNIYSRVASIALDGDDVYVTWVAGAFAFCNRSIDGGATWLNFPRQVSGSVFGSSPDISDIGIVDGAGAAVIAYVSGADVFATRSINEGIDWSAPIALNVGSSQTPYEDYVQVVTDGNHVHVAWMAGPTSFSRRDAFICSSHDGGQTWMPAVRLNSDPLGEDSVEELQIVAKGGEVFAAWIDYRNAPPNVFDARVYGVASSDGGLTWQPTDSRIDVAAGNEWRSSDLTLARSTNAVHVGWRDSEPLFGQGSYYLASSSDLGGTWAGQTTPLLSQVRTPHLVADGDTVALAWAETFEALGLSAMYSRDEAVTWRAPVRIDTSTGTSDLPWFVRLGIGAGRIHAAWNKGSGVWLYAYAMSNRLFGGQTHGVGTPGSFNITPTLSIEGFSVGGTMTVDVDNALGGATGALFLGFGPSTRIDLPIMGGQLYVIPNATAPLLFGGTTGTPGAGSTTLPLGLPNVFEIQGLNVNFQALILDAAAAQGVSMTAAEITWIG